MAIVLLYLCPFFPPPSGLPAGPWESNLLIRFPTATVPISKRFPSPRLRPSSNSDSLLSQSSSWTSNLPFDIDIAQFANEDYIYRFCN
ncbi:hypothetical protein L6164_014873 [Bauhinia variegata]|uniref:Uncharacterized protein n=1 Tax=Bauhinia variegata TaxID=167791 RepID=A0ACB9NNL7_BAUVA|nr:hypothetical protein L6164_014873 [Bauhinia variegata]